MTVASNYQQGLIDTSGRRASVLLNDFDGWYDGLAASDMASQLGRIADNVANQAAVFADTSTALMIREMTGRWPNPSTRMLEGTVRYGVTAAEAYNRLPRHYRYAVSRGLSDDLAMRSVVDRARRMLDLDVMLASREQQRSTLSANTGVVAGYRRVIRPELSKTGTCGLCVAASDRVYGVAELMPIHPGCKCAVMPIVGDHDPGAFVNRDDYARLEAAATPTGEHGARKRRDWSSVRVTIDEHGEYGPMLTDSRATRKSMEEVIDQTRDAREAQHQQNRAAVEREIRDAMVQPGRTQEKDRELVTAYRVLQNRS